MASYQVYLQDQEQSLATVDKYLWDVKLFLEYLGEEGKLEKERVRGIGGKAV